MDASELHILQHSLGLDQYGRGTFYRNHFCTGEGSLDHPSCMSLVEQGFMVRRANVEMFGGMDMFYVTPSGRSAVVEYSPAPPKLSPGKQRYLDYLNADCSMTFIEWCRWKTRARIT